jgi:hypothetical protein
MRSEHCFETTSFIHPTLAHQAQGRFPVTDAGRKTACQLRAMCWLVDTGFI